MRRYIYLLAILIIMSGCGYSLREAHIRDQRPDYLKEYKNGPISPLSEEDIQEAIEFGKANKHKQDIINYAFMFKKDVTNFLGDLRTIYILICTNYYLIANYSAMQSRNYEPMDMEYVNFLANLPTFRIEVVEQVAPSGKIEYSYQVQKKFVLFKDNIKVDQSSANPMYKDKNPYYASCLSGIQSNWQEIANKTIKQSMEMANKIAESYQKDMKINMDNILAPSVTKSNHLYNYKDIDLSSKYEVVVIYKNGEHRIPIDFSNIK